MPSKKVRGIYDKTIINIILNEMRYSLEPTTSVKGDDGRKWTCSFGVIFLVINRLFVINGDLGRRILLGVSTPTYTRTPNKHGQG